MAASPAPRPDVGVAPENTRELPLFNPRRAKAPTVLQMEAVECGAAALGMVLAHHGRFVPLEQLRLACGVSRDGSKASNVVKAARTYGLTARGFKKELGRLDDIPLPAILFWNFNHFVVLEGFGTKGRVYINDPAQGPRVLTTADLDFAFTGVVLLFETTPEFKKGGKRPSFWGALRRRLAGSELGVAYTVLAGLGLVLPGLVVPIFARVFVDDVLVAGAKDWFIPLLIGMGVTALLRGVLTWLQRLYLLRLEAKLALTSSARFLWHVLRLPIEFYTQRFPGEVAGRVQLNDRVSRLLSGDLASTMIDSVTIVFYALVMLSYDWMLTAVGVGLCGVNVAALKLMARRRADESHKMQRARGQLMGYSMGGLQMMETIKSGGTEHEFFSQWAGTHAKTMQATQGLQLYSTYLGGVPPLMNALTTVAILGIGASRVMDGHMSIGMLVAFQSLMASFQGPVSKLVTLAGTVQEVVADMARIDDVMRYPADRRLVAGETPRASTEGDDVKLTGHVELRNVSFGYSPLDAPLIENFNLVVKPGFRVALVGGSGSGKSTVARLICGLFEPWSGEVLFEGRPRSAWPRSVLTNSISLVDQDISFFRGSVRDNLALWDTTLAQSDVVTAAKDAAIHDDVMVRTDGYDSSLEEGGGNWSGGQRQRLEIARALAGSPRVIVLDEATSALDPATEKAIDDNLRRRGATCIIVAHRLSTIRDCDEIIVMERGKVVERGTHQELMAAQGRYAQLIEN